MEERRGEVSCDRRPRRLGRGGEVSCDRRPRGLGRGEEGRCRVTEGRGV